MAKKHKKHNKKSTHHKTEQSQHEKEEEQLIKEGLEAIYGKEGQKEVDFTKIEQARGRLTNILLTIVIALVLIAGLSWGGFFVYNRYFVIQETETFSLEIDVQEELVSGEKSTISIKYANPTNVQIAALDLDVRIPSTFIIDSLSPSPADEQELLWSVGNLPAGSDGVIIIEGTWLATVPSSLPIQVLANYRPGNFNSDFQEIETTYIQTLSSVLAVEFEGPEESTPGKIEDYALTLKNTSHEILEAVEIELALPDGFYIEESEPSIEAGQAPIWTFETLESDAEERIEFSGSFAADAEGFEYFDITTRVTQNNQSLVQTLAQGFTDVMGSEIDVQLIVNGGFSEATTGLGESLRITVAYENSGEEAIDDVALLLDFQSEEPLPINWNEADLDGGVVTSEGISWSESVIGEVPVNERQLLNLTFPINNSINAAQTDQFSVVAHANRSNIQVRSTPIEVAINSEATLTASARYYTDDGAPLGNGPIPPEVDSKTTYRVYWKIHNSLHDLENISVSATLPPHVTWESQNDTELGSISYNATSKIVIWEITNLTNDVENIQANFAISITPDSDDVGTFVKLTSGSILNATDSTTQSTLENTDESLTSELIGDDFAENKGIVVE
jgi:hypothetical protein